MSHISKKSPHLPTPFTPKEIVFASVGVMLCIFTLSFLHQFTSYLFLFVAFGATSIMAFGFPHSPFAQPRSIIIGHLVGAIWGLFFYHFISSNLLVVALPVGLSVATMMLLRTVHPPAVGNAIAVYLLKLGWGILFFPIASSCIIIIIMAYFYNNYLRKMNYPLYW